MALSPYLSKFSKSSETKKMVRNYTHDEVMRKSKIKRFCTVDALNLFWRERDVQRIDILAEMFNLPSPDNRENIWGLVHEVRNRD